jgi:hypothetical protein
MSQTVIMNGGESPLASKIKKGDATRAEQFAETGPGNNNGGAAPTFGHARASTSKEPSTSDDIVLATGSGIVRPRAASKKS